MMIVGCSLLGDNTNKGWDVVCEETNHGRCEMRGAGASRRRWLATYTPPRLFRCFMNVTGAEPIARIVGGIATLSRERGWVWERGLFSKQGREVKQRGRPTESRMVVDGS